MRIGFWNSLEQSLQFYFATGFSMLCWLFAFVSFRAMWQSRPTSLTEWENKPSTSIGLLMFQLVSLRYGYEWFMAKKLASAKTGGTGEWRSLFTNLRTSGFLRYFPWDVANVMGWMLSDWWWCKRNVVYCTLSLSRMWQQYSIRRVQWYLGI